MDTSKIEKLLAEFPKAPSPHGKDVPVLDVVFADPGNHGFYYRERMPDSRAAFIRTDHIAAAALRSLAEFDADVLRLTARIAQLEALVTAADGLAENLADNLTWVLPMARGYAAANPHDVNKRIVAGAEDDLATYRAAKDAKP